MATLLEDLTDIEEKAQGLVENKVANFAYTQEAYDNNDVDGVSEYNINNAQNIPIADAETLDVNSTVLNKGYRSQASSITRMLMNHFLGRTSYNLNKSIDLFKKGFLGIKNALGKTNGIATLDEKGYLNKEQLISVLTDEQLKKFIFSGKEPSLKSLQQFSNSSYDPTYFVYSINDKEDIIIVLDSNYRFYILKYNGSTLRQLDLVTFSSTISHLCRYKHFEIFYVKKSLTYPAEEITLIVFNYNTSQLKTKIITSDISKRVTFNKNTGKFNLINAYVTINASSSPVSQPLSLVSVNVENLLSVEEETLTVFLPAHSGSTIYSASVCISDNLLFICGAQLFVYDVRDAKSSAVNPFFNTENLPEEPAVIEKDTKLFFFSVGLSYQPEVKVFIADNGNVYSVPQANKFMLNSSFLLETMTDWDEFHCLTEKDSKPNYLLHIYKNDKLYTVLDISTSFLTPVYDSILYSSYIADRYIDVENNINVLAQPESNALTYVRKSDRRAYAMIRDSNNYKILYEITNVLD